MSSGGYLCRKVLLVTRAEVKLSQFVKTLLIPWTRQPELTRQQQILKVFVKWVQHLFTVTYKCYCTVCGFIICTFVLKLFVLCCLSQFYVLRPLLCFNLFKLLLSALFLLYCFISFAVYFACCVICFVSPYVYYHSLPFVYKCKDQCHQMET